MAGKEPYRAAGKSEHRTRQRCQLCRRKEGPTTGSRSILRSTSKSPHSTSLAADRLFCCRAAGRLCELDRGDFDCALSRVCSPDMFLLLFGGALPGDPHFRASKPPRPAAALPITPDHRRVIAGERLLTSRSTTADDLSRIHFVAASRPNEKLFVIKKTTIFHHH